MKKLYAPDTEQIPIFSIDNKPIKVELKRIVKHYHATLSTNYGPIVFEFHIGDKLSPCTRCIQSSGYFQSLDQEKKNEVYRIVENFVLNFIND